jgi:hypothetical protein
MSKLTPAPPEGSFKHARIEFKCVAVGCRLSVNGVLLLEEMYGKPRTFNTRLNQWLTKGKNVLLLEVKKPKLPPAPEESDDKDEDRPKKKEPPEPELSVRVRDWSGDVKYDEAPILLEVIWDPDKIPGREEHDIPIENRLAPWLWEKASIVGLTADDRKAVLDVVENLHAALDRKDISEVQRLLKAKTEEMARSVNLDFAQRMGDQAAFFQQLFGDSAWGLEPFSRKDAVIEVTGQNRLVRVTDKEGFSPIRSVPDEEDIRFSIPLYLTRVSGSWIIIR